MFGDEEEVHGKWEVPENYFLFTPLNLFNGRSVCPWGEGTYKGTYNGNNIKFIEFTIERMGAVRPIMDGNNKIVRYIPSDETFDEAELEFIKNSLIDKVIDDINCILTIEEQ